MRAAQQHSEVEEKAPVQPAAVPAKANGKLDPNAIFAIDTSLAEDGYWATIDGYKFKIARANNPVHEQYLAEMGESKLRAYQNSELTAEAYRVVNGELVAHCFLRGWDDRFVDFTKERAVDFCVKQPHITTQIITIATDYHWYLQREREADSKN